MALDPAQGGDPGQPSDSQPAGGEPSGEQPSVASRFFGGLVRSFRSVDDPQSEVALRQGGGEPKVEDKGGDGAEAKGDGQQADPKPGEGGEQQPFKVFATEEEYKRDIQAEQDRREAVRADREKARIATENRKRLRTEDPEAFARLDEQDEAERERSQAIASELATGLSGNLIDIYDAEFIVPAIAMLPEDKRQEAIDKVTSLQGRKDVLADVFDHVREDAHAKGKAEGIKEAEARLRGNPAFAKSVQREVRAETDSPDIVEAGSSNGNSKPDMNAWLRRGAGH